MPTNTGAAFTAQVNAWARQTEKRTLAIFRASAQRVIATMQEPVGKGGNMPVDTGYLRASIQASTSAMPSIDSGSRPAADTNYPASRQYVLAIASAKIGETIYVGYTASYAGYQENKRGFVRLAAMQWKQIVSRVTAEAKARGKQ